MQFKDKTGQVRGQKENFTGEPHRWTNVVGHTLRDHVAGGGGEATKSKYGNLQTCVRATTELLNSNAGRTALQALDGDKLDVQFQSALTGDYYGLEFGATKKRITIACCVIYALGNSTLWIHTSYPKRFQ